MAPVARAARGPFLLLICGYALQVVVAKRMLPLRASASQSRVVTPSLRARNPPMQLIAESGHSATAVSELQNHKDIQFVFEVLVGGQRLRVVPDSGSFSLVLTSKRCEETTCPVRIFDPSHSGSYEALHWGRETLFGSGRLWMMAAHDELVLAGRGPQKQLFWEITQVSDAMRDMWSQAMFDGILGLSWRKSVPDAENETAVLESFGIGLFSACFGRAGKWLSMAPSGRIKEVIPYNGGVNGTPSRIYWSSRWSTVHAGATVAYLDVIGNQHWAVNLSQVALQDHTAAATRSNGSTAFKKLSCWDQPCAAVIDTASSLIEVPTEHLSELLKRIGRVHLGCDNFDKLPNLHLHLGSTVNGGIDIVLPPRSYVKRVQLSSSNDPGKPMSEPQELCTLKIGESRVIKGDIPVWILGVPFLQEYVCEFDRSGSPPRIGVAAHPGVCPSGHLASSHLGTLSVSSRLTSGHIAAHDDANPYAGGGTWLPDVPGVENLPDVPSLMGLGTEEIRL
eukprot:gnl/TRDRNA2_/TRDRNA2_37032_c0_seq1.p1 gnl/TRDRNA2_/TRDRNA2_37032_c0~~gnl/TRDRNA2_/TRDRNA2_37032_c0_seq1.p1  ORF type:complete len:507 (-),score=50.29 gnl/TRDRNA2_/TRDRNA2_37032_c0_seq1:66-1586(-)